MLRVDHISKSYDGNLALENVSFVAENGRVVALCGENGAGKSTMMRILSGAILPDSGEILIDGERISHRPTRAMRSRLGIRTVYQELSLLPHLTVAENIMLGRMPAAGPRWRVDWRAARGSRIGGLAGIRISRDRRPRPRLRPFRVAAADGRDRQGAGRTAARPHPRRTDCGALGQRKPIALRPHPAN